MLDYDWQGANPSLMMLSQEDSNVAVDVQYAAAAGESSFSAGHIQLTGRPIGSATAFSPFFSPHYQQNPYCTSAPYPHGGDFSVETFSGDGDGGFLLPLPKSEEVLVLRPPAVDFTARLGLNLGGRTYFSSAEDDIVSPFYRRTRPPESVKVTRCQAEGCNADLTHAKHYHRRHRVCEYHSKAAAVVAAGLTQRFCQQCSRFHLLSEFDNGKRSCRKRLSDHNKRRRKSHLPNLRTQKPQLHSGQNPLIDNFVKSPGQESGTQSSVTVAVSPPRLMLDCFELQRPYYNQAASASSSSISSSSLFFSTS